MRRIQSKLSEGGDRSFKVTFNSGHSIFHDVGFSKTTNNFDVKSGLDSKDEDIYYDEIVIYDGGGVDEYGS